MLDEDTERTAGLHLRRRWRTRSIGVQPFQATSGSDFLFIADFYTEPERETFARAVGQMMFGDLSISV